MKAARYRNRGHVVAKVLDDHSQLANALGIRPRGQAHEYLAPDAKDISTLECPGKFDVGRFAWRREFGDNQRCFPTAVFVAQVENDRDFVQNEGWVLNEHGVRQI